MRAALRCQLVDWEERQREGERENGAGNGATDPGSPDLPELITAITQPPLADAKH